jgi:RNA polymerase sigma-70 factor (ECF subfamily)
MNEEEAIKSILKGNSSAFGTLYDLYVDRVYRFVYYRTHHKQTAEDLTSTIFTKAFAKFASFDPSQNFAVWLFRIARNTVIDHYRVSKSTDDIEAAFNISDKTNISRDYELKEKLDAAVEYLKSLPPEQRELMIMRVWDGLSYAEIAAITEKKEAALRVSFSRILARMHKELVISILFLILIWSK